MLTYILISTFIVSLLAFIGIFTLYMNEELLNKILLLLVSFSAGALMGGAFLHLLPEAVNQFGANQIFLYALLGFILFFFLEKILYWRHCHKGNCEVHTFTYMNLIGDTVHNFIDGLVIAASFLVNTALGIASTMAIIFHEVPQEIGDYGVLVYGGFDRKKALLLNFAVATTVILGGLIGYYVYGHIQGFIKFLLPLAAGGFLYIAATDLIPELRKEVGFKKSIATFIVFLIGIGIMYLARVMFG